jgi:ABC-2 type transport system ATP-binding protein
MTNELSIQITNLVKTFSQNEIIKNLNMKVPKKSIYGLLGPNGAGKTTVFKLLMGLLTPTAGNIIISGMDAVSCRDSVLKMIGSIIEYPHFYDHLSARENLELHLSYMEVQGLDINRTLDDVGLKNTNNQPVSTFSLGMRQRLGIARAIIHNPQILLLDEPINGLDPIGIREMRELFLRLKDEGKTILISSHLLSEIEQLVDIIGVMANGTLIEEVSLDFLRNNNPSTSLEDYFLNLMRGEITYA